VLDVWICGDRGAWRYAELTLEELTLERTVNMYSYNQILTFLHGLGL